MRLDAEWYLKCSCEGYTRRRKELRIVSEEEKKRRNGEEGKAGLYGCVHFDAEHFVQEYAALCHIQPCEAMISFTLYWCIHSWSALHESTNKYTYRSVVSSSARYTYRGTKSSSGEMQLSIKSGQASPTLYCSDYNAHRVLQDVLDIHLTLVILTSMKLFYGVL